MQFFHVESESDTARAMLEMVRRRAPALMRAAGGSLPRELACGAAKRLSPEQRAEIERLLRARVPVMKVAAQVGTSQTTVSKVKKQMGLLVPSPRVRVEVAA